MKNNMRRGFTLIELLVVIAIIGILSAVVLASLNTARNKGADAAIKSNLNNARAQAELYYTDNSNSYLTVCTTPSSSTPGGIATMITGASSAYGTANTATCADVAGAWRASSLLKSSPTTYYCVDSTGKSTLPTAAPSGTACL